MIGRSDNFPYTPGLAGIPAAESSISHIDGEKGILTYRGYDIKELAKLSSFEETSMLLLYGVLPDRQSLQRFTQELQANRRVKFNIREMMKFLPATTGSMHMLQVVVASLASFYPSTDYLKGGEASHEYINDVSTKILAHMGTLVAMWNHMREGYDPIPPRTDLSYAGNLLYMVTGQEPEANWERILDACLILHAEHTMNASTFTSRVTGSTLANPCSVISSAVASLSGPLHGGANEMVIHMLQEIGHPKHAAAYIDQKLKNKELIWGMGHREYKTKDPRATILQELAEEYVLNRPGVKLSRLYETALEVEKICEDRLGHKGVFPNVDFYSGILYQEMGINPSLFTPFFAVARTAGWLAHWREQLFNNRIFRPTQIYKGSGGRCYLSLGERDHLHKEKTQTFATQQTDD